MKDLIFDTRGITLIELVASIAIVSVIAVLAFSFFTFGNRAFNLGNTNADLQSHVRLGAGAVTDEIRNSSTLSILSTAPGTFDADKKYIYLENNRIKLNFGVVTKEITNEFPGGINLSFTKNESNVLTFLIEGNPGEDSYSIESNVCILNMSNGSIDGAASGTAICFGPFNDDEVVAADAMNLDLLEINNLTNSYITGSLLLPATGANGSTITWLSDNTSVIENNGTVHRPGTTGADTIVTLTATFTEGTTVQYKNFIFTVLKRNVLSLNESPLPPDGTVDIPYSFQFTSTGGYEGYNYSISAGSLPDGLSLTASSGVLSGTPVASGTYVFTVMVEDLDDIENEPNATDSHEFTIIISSE
jgi:type II secretory pathway pseudopilin PulG